LQLAGRRGKIIFWNKIQLGKNVRDSYTKLASKCNQKMWPRNFVDRKPKTASRKRLLKDGRMTRQDLQRSKARQRGVVTVEFAVLLPLLVVFLVGIVEFGHVWYLRHALTNASREGARYAVAYRVNSSGQRLIPSKEQVAAWVQERIGAGWWEFYDVELEDYPPNSTASGAPVTVTLTANQNDFLLLGALLQYPGA
jgi:hypothetical protein